MNQLATVDQQEHAQPVAIASAAMMMSPTQMNALVGFAELMAQSAFTVPEHLRGKPSDCLAIAMQAAQWGMNPFAVAQKTHIVSGRLGYEAQLVQAVVMASGAIRGTFEYEYRGEGNGMECRVGAMLRNGTEVKWNEWLATSSVTTKNSPLWKTNPKQQMGYLQVKNWARANTPGALLGVYTIDELEDMPAMPARRDAPPAQVAAAALPKAERTDVHDIMLADLEKVAAEQGTKAFKVSWMKLTEDDRVALGGVPERDRLLAMALRTDEQKAQADAPAVAQETAS